MRLLIIRHGDPDYSIDSLTEKGWREAELLAPRLMREGITDVFVSPLGRARDTARPYLAASGKSARVLEWLREFPSGLDPSEHYSACGIEPTSDRCAWNLYPQFWRSQEELFTENGWREHPLYAASYVPAAYDRISAELFALLGRFGYLRRGSMFSITPETDENRCVALFCHMGLGLSLLAALSRAPLPMLWETLFLPTTSVTTVFMEKYPPYFDEAQARVIHVGDTSHLYAGGEPVSGSGLHWRPETDHLK